MREKRHAARRAARTAVTSRFVVLTGLSGSGKSQAIRALEDLGYFCVDNLPIALLPMLAELTLRAGTEIARAAVVVDVAAKELGGNRMLAAAPDSDEMQVRAATMRSALQVREALDERRFELYCQPIVDLNTPRAPQRHFEILLRWTDAGGAVRAPAELIAAAERYRLGPRLDRYVVDATLNWLEQHPDAAAMVEHCSINLGGATLVRGDDVLERK